MKNVYLAGPDVFFRESEQHFRALEIACNRWNLKGVRPSDGGVSELIKAGASKAQQAERIYRNNVALIHRSDVVLANLMPFRGSVEPDSGTVFEVGMAVALGKPVACLVPDAHLSFEEKVAQSFGVGERSSQGLVYDATFDMQMEEFGQPLNLMLARSCRVFAGVEEALAYLAGLP